MNTLSTFITIEQKDLLAYCQGKKHEGWRFVQMHAVAGTNRNDLYYSFMKDAFIENAVIRGLDPQDHIPSISSLFLAAFVFENEARELFGIHIDNIEIDFHGTFYDLSESTPMNASITLHPATSVSHVDTKDQNIDQAKDQEPQLQKNTANSDPVLLLRKECIGNLDDAKRALFNAALKRKGLSLEDVISKRAIAASLTKSNKPIKEAKQTKSQVIKQESIPSSEIQKEIKNDARDAKDEDRQLSELISIMKQDRAKIVKELFEGASKDAQNKDSSAPLSTKNKDRQLSNLISNMETDRAEIVKELLKEKDDKYV